MKKKMVTLVGFATGFSICCLARAATQDIGNVYIADILKVAVTSGAQIAGNLEIEVKGGFALSGVSCTNNLFVTTLQTTDPNNSLLSVLLTARAANLPVGLRITDDPQHQAVQGNCSLVWVYM